MKQEYIDENSQSSISDSIDMHHERYRPISESSLDVNHDSNMSMINENSVEMMHHDSMMSHMSENSNLSINEESIDVVRRNSISMCENAVMKEDASIMHPIVNERVVMEKVMDLRMKLPMNASVTDFVTTASSIAELKRFGIEHSSAPLPPQSAQSVENYLTKIESKPDLLPNNKVPTLLVSAPQNVDQTVYLTSQQPFLPESNAINTIAKSEAAVIAEQVLTGTTPTSNASTTLTTSLEGSISTPINTEKLDEILNSTLESHIIISPTKTATTVDPIVASQDVMLTTEPSLVLDASPLLVPQETQTPASLTPDAILNTQLSPSCMCGNSPAVQQEPLIGVMCQGTATSSDSNLTTIAASQSAALLNSEPEKAVLLEAAVDFLKTQKRLCELTTTSQNIMGINSTSTDTNALEMDNSMANGFMPFPTTVPNANDGTSPISEPKRDFLPLSVKDVAQNDKKNEDRMIPQSFTSLTENELISLINPTCFDQGNNYHH